MHPLSVINLISSEKRLQLDIDTGKLVPSPKKKLFLKGPVPIDWLSRAAELPGKTLNVALAIWWLKGMTQSESFKLTRKSLSLLCIKRDAASISLKRLEGAGLIKIQRRLGQRPTIFINLLDEIKADQKSTLAINMPWLET
ncbi:MAG: hypothetical protein WCO72_15705 [Betaproteobacteria bacterium]